LKNIYKHYIPVKTLFLLELICGTVILTFFLYLFKNDIYPDIWAFAGPLLSVALIITGLTSSKIKEINVHFSQQLIEINKESLFSSKNIKIKFHCLKSELKTGNGKKNSIITKLRLVILDSDEEIDELNSNFLGFNNSKLRKLHSDLKEISKKAIASRVGKGEFHP
jgi:hypothetical protein